MMYGMGQNGNGNGAAVSFSTNGNGATLHTEGREMTPEELQALQNAASSIGQGVQRGLSLGVAVVSFGVGVGLGYLLWGRS